MKIVTGVRFKRPGKIYYFDPENLQLEKGMKVITAGSVTEGSNVKIVGSK